MPSACSIPGTGHRVPTSAGVSGCSPLPSNDTKPSFVAASAVVYWCGRREPKAGGWKALWGAEGAPREPEPWLLRQGPISSLTKAAMQYWRATGNPKLQYLRAARALLTALHPSASPLPPDPPFLPPNTGKPSTWLILCWGKDRRAGGAGHGAPASAGHPVLENKESFLPAGTAPLTHTHSRGMYLSLQRVCTEKSAEETYLHVPVQLS